MFRSSPAELGRIGKKLGRILYSTTACDLSDDPIIPWHHTTNMSNARNTLQQMYDHFPEDSPVKLYLKANCAHLLNKPLGNTGISVFYLNSDDWRNKPHMPAGFSAKLSPISLLTSWGGKNRQEWQGTLPRTGRKLNIGVYAIYSPNSDHYCVGSTTNYTMRLANHYSDSRNPALFHRPLYAEVPQVGGWMHMIFDSIIHTPNYETDFLKRYLKYTNNYTVFLSQSLPE